MMCLVSDMTLEPTTTAQTVQHKRNLWMLFTAPSLMFTVATAGCESYAANDATLAGSELDVQSRVGQHGCVGVEGPRNG